MKSLEDRLSECRGIGPGFDFLRIGLAASIVMVHVALLSDREWFRQTPFWYVEYALVPMFFALSGFLICASALRLSLGNFLVNRGLRIVPALAVDIVICALIIGPAMTSLPLSQYFSDHHFFDYFLNITGWIHYDLPGVFQENYNKRVNDALWTVPFELACYAVMSLLMVTGTIARPRVTLLVTLGYLGAGLVVQVLVARQFLAHEGVPALLFVSRGAQLVAAFLMGVVLYQNRRRIPYSRAAAAVCAAIALSGIVLLSPRSISAVGNRFLFLPALVYVTVWIGLTPVPLPRLLRTGDYSYGVYLYHDPLLQILVALLPIGLVAGGYGWFVLVGVGLAAAGLVAAFSWHMIEKPILGLRKRFVFVASLRGVDAADTGRKGASEPAPGLPERS